MRRCVRLAKKYHVKLGAHPGIASPDFGRGPVRIEPDELELALLQQVGSLDRLASSERVKLHHIKLHGGLYHATERNEKLARAYLQAVGRWWPKVVVYAFAGGTVASLAMQAGVKVWPEAFLDRGYRKDGSLVPRNQPNALLSGRAAFVRRLESISRMAVRTVCIHSDTPNAVELARLARQRLRIR
jgi:5-oxoprolinase (ATP-hydrolysing) subunit A